MSDVGLKSLTAEIDVRPGSASGLDAGLSLPHGGDGGSGNLAPALAQRTPLHQLQAIHGGYNRVIAGSGAEEMSAIGSLMSSAAAQHAGERAHRMRLHVAAARQ